MANEQVLVLLEEIAKVNGELNNENRKLSEELKTRDEENKRIIRGLENKIDAAVSSPSVSGSPARNSRKLKKSAVRIPGHCRVCVTCFKYTYYIVYTMLNN